MSWIVGVDVGGTFTDFFAFDLKAGTRYLHKRPSTPDQPAASIVDGLLEICEEYDIPSDTVVRLCHGTTVATNALIQRNGGRVALITTKGFRDLLEIGRQTRPHTFDMQTDFPAPLVPRDRRLEISERVSADGEILKHLIDSDITKLVAYIGSLADVDACAVCFLFSFLNPTHEGAVGEHLRQALPHLHVSLSCDVLPEFREFERLSATVTNAYLQPVLVRYLDALVQGIRTHFPMMRAGVNQSSGGLMSLERARAFPIRTALSGPAAGVVGAMASGRMAQETDFITLDVGGTSADVSLIRNGEASSGSERWIGGFPIRIPMVDVHTIGAGGGSIAWFSPDELLQVGPRSAGACPGPACYGLGGTEPTVTDANLILGRLSTRGLLGGRMKLDLERARDVVARVSERLGYTMEHTANGIVEIVVSNMVRATRAISTEKGHDPRRFALMAFGGAGPLHASAVARSLGIRKIIIPAAPGIVCAEGLIFSDIREDFARTVRLRLHDVNLEAIQHRLKGLLAQATAWFNAENITTADRITRAKLDMRYVGQNFELTIDIPHEIESVASLSDTFFSAHERQYGYHSDDDPIEIVTIRLIALGQLPKPRPTRSARSTDPVSEPLEVRHVWFGPSAPTSTPVHDRSLLLAGQTLDGPAVIEQLDATTVLFPNDTLQIDENMNMIIQVAKNGH